MGMQLFVKACWTFSACHACMMHAGPRCTCLIWPKEIKKRIVCCKIVWYPCVAMMNVGMGSWPGRMEKVNGKLSILFLFLVGRGCMR